MPTRYPIERVLLEHQGKCAAGAAPNRRFERPGCAWRSAHRGSQATRRSARVGRRALVALAAGQRLPERGRAARGASASTAGSSTAGRGARAGNVRRRARPPSRRARRDGSRRWDDPCVQRRGGWCRDSVLPSGSWNQATREPSGVSQMPSASSGSPGKRAIATPAAASARTVAAGRPPPSRGAVYGMRRDGLHALHAQWRAVGVEDERVAVVLDEREPQLALVEGPGAVGVGGGGEADESDMGSACGAFAIVSVRPAVRRARRRFVGPAYQRSAPALRADPGAPAQQADRIASRSSRRACRRSPWSAGWRRAAGRTDRRRGRRSAAPRSARPGAARAAATTRSPRCALGV